MTTTGAIVAGGASSRFGGSPKGLSLVGGQRIIDRVAHALRRATDDLVLVANAPEAASWLTGVPVTRDRLENRGLMVGIDAALAWADGPVLAVGWDMPFVTEELLLLLRKEGEAAGAPAVVEGPRGVEGACAYYTPACRPVIAELAKRGELRLRALFEAIPATRRIRVDRVATLGDPETLFLNVNTAADLERANRIAAGAQ